jgi:DNA invertase Pin-like site-specific DNA recombinase
MKYVNYLRVSTVKQGNSGLGLEAQKTMINNFLKPGDEVIAEFTEVISGRRIDRPKLKQAIELTKQHDAKLLIAKLDRLARNATFIGELMQSGVQFIAANTPEANWLTVSLLSILSENESNEIKTRTKNALAEAKKRGVKLGKPENLTPEAIAKGRKAMQENAFNDPVNQKAGHVIVLLRKEGYSFYKIARYLNSNGFRTRRGNKHSIAGTTQLFNRYKDYFKI